MTQLALIKGSQLSLDKVNLFEDSGAGGQQLRIFREREQRKRLEKVAREVSEMLDRLNEEMRTDSERAASSVAEYVGLFEKAADEVCEIRDVDEEFGCPDRRRQATVELAERLEKGLNYLVGIFSVVATSKNVGSYNWKLVQHDIHEVLAMSRAIAFDQSAVLEKMAA